MKGLMVAALVSVFAIGSALAEECRPIDKNGQLLAGAARASHMKSCCKRNAVDKNGKLMRGIVKRQFLDKCMQG